MHRRPVERTLPNRLQFSLRIVLGALTLTAVFLAVFLGLVRSSDFPSACLYLAFLTWLTSPVLATFGYLYLRTARGPL
jgi:hypothetical protein